MRKKETPNPSRVRGRGVEVSETLFYTHFKVVVLKSVLFETTKKRLINSHEMYGHPFMERSSIYVHILRLVKER